MSFKFMRIRITINYFRLICVASFKLVERNARQKLFKYSLLYEKKSYLKYVYRVEEDNA